MNLIEFRLIRCCPLWFAVELDHKTALLQSVLAVGQQTESLPSPAFVFVWFVEFGSVSFSLIFRFKMYETSGLLLSCGGVSGRKQPMSGVVGWKSVTINCSVTGEEPKSSTNSNRSHTRSPHRSVCCQGWMPSLSWINPLTFWIKVLASTFRVMVLPLKVWTKIWNSWTNFVWFDFVEFRFD